MALMAIAKLWGVYFGAFLIMIDFKTIYDKYWTELVYYAYKKTGDNEEAKDIVQNLFIHILPRLQEFPSENDLRYYLFSNIKYRCIDYAKRPGDERLTDCIDSDTEDYDLLETELVTLIYKHMESLPQVRLKIFTRLFLDGKKLQEVADELHISIHTVKSQRAKALISLRKILV